MPSKPTPSPQDLDPAQIAAVREGLLAWFAANARNLPWRHTRDPYLILVSEIMLQQTQVDRVIPYYHTFLDRFPTVQDLAAGPTAEVIRLWSGLGYNRRAVNLQRTARAVVTDHGGVFPRDAAALRALPGIGPYTAGAIAAFAFEDDAAFIDTNMRRVLHRLFFGVDVPVLLASEKEILAVAAAVVPPGKGWVWNQALIEFGALQCTARKPACVICPLQATCRAYPAIQTALAELPRGVRKKQEPTFAGSNRYFRGRVIETLRELPSSADAGVSLRDLGLQIRPDFTESDLPWLYKVVLGLRRDGLARVAEDAPTYDPSGRGDTETGDILVNLP